MSKLTFTVLLILTFLLSAAFTIWVIKLFFKGLLFLMMHPIQTFFLLIFFWIFVKIFKSIIC